MVGHEPEDVIGEVTAGYAFAAPAIELGALVVDGTAHPEAAVRIPLSMVTRHGLVSGATGTGKTKTLQLMAEQLSAAGVPVLTADIKGDLSGLAMPGEATDRTAARAREVGQAWTATGVPVELLTLGGEGVGVPLRATMTSFGPTLLAKVLDLGDVQESSLGLVFHFADKAGLPMLDLKDLRAVIAYLISDEGKAELEGLGGLSKATAGVILRDLIAFEDQGAERFFGEPEFETADLLRVAADGRGVVSLLELPRLADRPRLFSTFLMWLLADLFHDLPEVGDVEKPKLVFFFVTQTPKDVPAEVLSQLGNRVQHALRAFTPQDAKELRATVSTFPHSSYDLEEVLTQLGIGEAVITVLSERGAPTPVAWTRLRAPQSRMAPADAAVLTAVVSGSPMHAKYAEHVDRDSAHERLAARLRTAPAPPSRRTTIPRAPEPDRSTAEKVLGSPAFKQLARSAAAVVGREIARSLFGTARRRR